MTTRKRALLSVYNKDGIEEFAKKLDKLGFEILSTGGTASILKDANIPITDVSEVTNFPEIMDGRVKTLHPKIHGGILGNWDNKDHADIAVSHDITPINLVVVNLYPFKKIAESDSDFDTCIENIDIGGPAMIRAAAKNHKHVTIVTSPDDYIKVIDHMKENNGNTSFSMRQSLAAKAFSTTAEYDTDISTWMMKNASQDKKDTDSFPEKITVTATLKATLRYGENPHQSAALYLDNTKRHGVASASQLQGKELSYNNLNDTDAAYELVSEFQDVPTVAIIKHANPCGIASADDILTAYQKALMCDPISAFGGIIALNRPLNAATASEIIKVFSEVIIAPSIENNALTILKNKENIRMLTTGELPNPLDKRQMIKTISGGFLVQDCDTHNLSEKDLNIVSDREPTDEEVKNMIFAFKVAKHVKSNAIVYAKDMMSVGIGAGQMNRVDSTFIAARKAQIATDRAQLDTLLTKGSVVASDAFFPFPDGLITAAEAGATAIIQPGGSIRDKEVIAAANDRGLAMVFTGTRHFKH